MEKPQEKSKFLKFGFYYKDGKIYFNRQNERQFYFILTMLMLILGILYKLGIL